MSLPVFSSEPAGQATALCAATPSLLAVWPFAWQGISRNTPLSRTARDVNDHA